MYKLTGNEAWVNAFNNGSEIYIRNWGNRDFWWPLIFVDLDSSLIKIDVCGKSQNMHLNDCAELKYDGLIVKNEDFYI